jgi:hypothetical protein
MIAVTKQQTLDTIIVANKINLLWQLEGWRHLDLSSHTEETI